MPDLVESSKKLKIIKIDLLAPFTPKAFLFPFFAANPSWRERITI
jgi:hypothetical protein